MTMKQNDMIGLSKVVPLIEAKEAPSPISANEPKPLQQAHEDYEREYILRILEENDWKIAKAAQALHIDRANLYREMRGLGITAK